MTRSNGRRPAIGSARVQDARQHVLARFTAEHREYADTVVNVMRPVVPVLAQALRPPTEVVLHDFTRFPKTIVAISGQITRRRVGGPPTELGLRIIAASMDSEDLIGYKGAAVDGRPVRSSTIYFRYLDGLPVGSLCLNTDISALVAARHTLDAIGEVQPLDAITAAIDGEEEKFPTSVDGLAEDVLGEAIAATGIPPEMMRRSDKVDVVQTLEQRGFFSIRGAVGLASSRLRVSRHTVYNYLAENTGTDGNTTNKSGDRR